MNDDFEISEALKGSPKSPKSPEFIDPEDDKENWPTIMIDPEKGAPNYEFVAAHGTKADGTPFGKDYQIMRGIEVAVPPSVVNVLKLAMATTYEQAQDPVTGKNKLIRQDRSSIPWRLVKPGKYFS